MLGYVRESPQGQMQMIAPISSLSSVFIEAVMIFPAGAVRIGEYERILQDVHEIDQRVKRPVDKD